jgi:hypothetical protein
MVGHSEGADARAIGAIQRRAQIRNLEVPAASVDAHTFAWGRVSQALLKGRNPSVEDLLVAIAADASIPENVQIYAEMLLSKEVKPTAGPKPKWGLNHDAWQSARDVILVERFEALRRELKQKRPEKKITLEDVFKEIVSRAWGGAEAWGEMAGDEKSEPWSYESARARYFEARGRLLAGKSDRPRSNS